MMRVIYIGSISMGAMPVGCNKQLSPIKEGVIIRLQCTFVFNTRMLHRFDGCSL